MPKDKLGYNTGKKKHINFMGGGGGGSGGGTTQNGYKDIVRLYREKTRRSKAQLELNLVNTVNNKRVAKKNIQPITILL